MQTPSNADIAGNANIIGNDNRLNTYNIISAIPDMLPEPQDSLTSTRPDYVTVAILGVFIAFCVVVIVAPVLLYQYSARSPAMIELTGLILTLSSAMSGVTGLLGVIVGYRIRDRTYGRLR